MKEKGKRREKRNPEGKLWQLPLSQEPWYSGPLVQAKWSWEPGGESAEGTEVGSEGSWLSLAS